MKKKRRRKIIWQVLWPIFIAFGLLIFIDILILKFISSAYSLDAYYQSADMLALDASAELKNYNALEWLLDYWQKNYAEMEYIYGDTRQFASKAAKLRKNNPDITELFFVTPEEAKKMTPEDQKIFAELCYSSLSSDFDRLKDSLKPLYLYSFDVDDNGEMFFFVTGTTKSETRRSSGGELYELGYRDVYDRTNYSVLNRILESGTRVQEPDLYDTGAGAPVTLHAYEPIIIRGEVKAVVGVALLFQDVIDSRDAMVTILLSTTILLMTSLVIVIIYRISRVVVRPIKYGQKSIVDYEKTKDSQEAVRHLSYIRSNNEIQSLTESFASMVKELDDYMDTIRMVTAEKERIGAELGVATKIQADMLPSKFPPFPDRREFDIYASMTPAKEVGGDFYDFFLIDEDHLALVIADVSGKGVPAALFMVVSKTMIKNRAQFGDNAPGKVLSEVNDQLCEGNEAQLFVTVWLGILTISTGHMICANAGHESPAIRKKDGNFELFKDKHGVPLAAVEGMHYREYELQLEPGDILFEYTDGVTEATNLENKLFGKERLIDTLNESTAGEDMKKQDEELRDAIAEFVNGAPQFDDITMLGFVYHGPGPDRTKEEGV